MTTIEKILNPAFLLKLVSIEKLQYYATIDTSVKDKGLNSKVELSVMLLEPSGNEIKEQIYKLILSNVTEYHIDFSSADSRTFEFDTDEVQLNKDTKAKGTYTLSFVNSSVNLDIKFSEIEIDHDLKL